MIDIAEAGGLIKVTCSGASGRTALYARKIVPATGQEGMGDWLSERC